MIERAAVAFLGAMVSLYPWGVFGGPVAAHGVQLEGRAADTVQGDRLVTLGGVTGLRSLADPEATRRLRASGLVGLYIHAEGWKSLDEAIRAKILANFRDTGPAIVELGFVPRGPRQYAGVHSGRQGVWPLDGRNCIHAERGWIQDKELPRPRLGLHARCRSSRWGSGGRCAAASLLRAEESLPAVRRRRNSVGKSRRA